MLFSIYYCFSCILQPSSITDLSVLTDLASASAASPSPTSGQIRRRPKQQTPSPSPDSNGFKEMAAKALNVMSSRIRQDECSVFGEYVATELRSLPPDRAAYVKRKLTRALLDLMDEVAELMVSA